MWAQIHAVQGYNRTVNLAPALLIAICLNAYAQEGPIAAKPESVESLHSKAVKLVEVTGVRNRLMAALPEMVEQGKAAMTKQCPNCAPAFIEEWGKRMAARFKVDDILDVTAKAYAKRFTGEELSELLAAFGSRKAIDPAALSPALQKRIVELLPAIMGEITGASTEMGAKLGSEVASEIEKEHPEYVVPKPKPEKP